MLVDPATLPDQPQWQADPLNLFVVVEAGVALLARLQETVAAGGEGAGVGALVVVVLVAVVAQLAAELAAASEPVLELTLAEPAQPARATPRALGSDII